MGDTPSTKTTPAAWLGLAVVIGAGILYNVQASRDKESSESLAISASNAVKDKRLVIGMTVSQAVQSWGEPAKINKTTTARGTREQWVYPGGTYLYFDESGKLTTIQN